jgi:hypothetical protein
MENHKAIPGLLDIGNKIEGLAPAMARASHLKLKPYL